MASLDHARKRISASVLLYGPPGAGKTTSLYALARQLPGGTHGKVGPLAGGDDRLLRLDYRPNDQDMVYGYQVSFRLVACPGSIEVDLLRPLLGAIDAVMFVADSSRQALQANAKALELLDRMVRSAGRSLSDIPLVFLYNKRDLREAVEIRTLEERLNKYGCSYIAASALRGQGVLDGLQRLTASVAVQARQQVQAEGGGSAGGNVKTQAHGQTIQAARKLNQPPPRPADNDDVTAVSTAAGGPGGWDIDDDDRTEVNHGGSSGGDDQTDWGVAEPGDRTRPRGQLIDESSDFTAPRHDRPESPVDEWAASAAPARREEAPQRAPGRAGGFRELTPLDRRPQQRRAPAPTPAASVAEGEDVLWRTPQQFVGDVDSDDRTMPFREHMDDDGGGYDAGGYDAGASADDITQTQLGRGATRPATEAPAGQSIRTNLQQVSRKSAPGARPPAARPLAAEPIRQAAATQSRVRRVERGSPARAVSTPAAPAPRAASRPPAARAASSARAPAQASARAPAQASARAPAQASVRTPAPAPPPPVEAPGQFTATQVINSLGHQPEAWEGQVRSTAHMMPIAVPDLDGYVVSRIGTPNAATRRTVQIPVRATHMDTLMPQDFMLQIEFRSNIPGHSAPVASARKTSDPDDNSVPRSWLIGTVGLFVVIIAAIVLGMSSMG